MCFFLNCLGSWIVAKTEISLSIYSSVLLEIIRQVNFSSIPFFHLYVVFVGFLMLNRSFSCSYAPRTFFMSINLAMLGSLTIVVAAGLVEERMVCLGQQHSGNKVVVFAAVVKDSTI